MIEPVKMCKVVVVGSKRVLDDIVDILHSLKLVHIDDYKQGKYKEATGYFEIGSPFDRASKLSEELVKTRILQSNLKVKKADFEKTKISANAKEKLKGIEEKFIKLTEKKKKTEQELSDNKSFQEPLELLASLKINTKMLRPTEELSIFKGTAGEDFEEDLKKITKNYELFKAKSDEKIMFLLFAQKKSSQDVLNLLVKNKYREISIPEKFKFKNLGELREKQNLLHDELENTNNKINELRKKEGSFLVSYESALRKENEKAEAPLKFATSENSFLIEGYLPTESYEALKKTLEDKLRKNIYIQKEAGEYEFLPTELKNPQLVDAFEFFINMYSLPTYREIDPTFIMFLTFPLFFGFMLGDIGYGIACLITFIIIKWRAKTNVIKGLMNVFSLSAVSTIIFGFVFGEFFGETIIKPPLLNREHDTMLMIILTILIGITHINIGFIFGFLNAKNRHGLKHAILEKGSFFIIETGAFLLILQNLNYLNFIYQMYAGAAIMVLGVVMLAIGGGAHGLIELPSVLSNILSYARLFALGLASVSLALIMNQFATALIEKGWAYFPLALIILVFGHGLNIAIGILGGFLQSLRLHYVEFFTKFYEGGGKRYNPFGA